MKTWLSGALLLLTPLIGCQQLVYEPPAIAFAAGVGVNATEGRPTAKTGMVGGEPRAFSLAECVEAALRSNPDILISTSGVDAAAARVAGAAADGRPSIAFSTSYTSYLTDQPLVPPTPPNTVTLASDIAGAELVLTVPLYTGGQVAGRVAASRSGHEAAEATAEHVKRSVVFGVTRAYYQIAAQRQLVQSIESSLRALAEQRTVVKSLIEQERAANVDLQRVEVRISEVEQQLARARQDLSLSRRELAGLMGLADVNSLATSDPPLELIDATPDFEQSAARALENRADLLAAANAARAQSSLVDVARSAAKPKVSAFGSLGVRYAAVAESIPPGADEIEDVGAIGLRIDVPVFTAGRVSARTREARADLAAAEARLVALTLKIRAEVEAAILAVDTTRAQAVSAAAARKYAQESLRIERQKYALGRGTISDVLESEAALTRARAGHHVAVAAHRIAFEQLRYATGERSRP